MGRLVRRGLVGQGNDTIDGLGGSGGMREGRVLSRVSPSILSPHKALLPAPDHGLALADGAHDTSGALAVGGQNNDPRAPHVLLRTVASGMIDLSAPDPPG